ncbi:MAG: acyl-CoA thioesterase [Gemmatimonadota bacterium]|nr:acyl-CoA thioesterase [Gemmatimonadota bacterium]
MTRRPFTIDEYVRWSDVDHAGIIFYGAYVRFFEIAETEMFRSAGLPYGEFFHRFGIWLPRAHFDCDFTYPARLDDRLRVATYVSQFGRSSLTLSFEVLHVEAGRLAATAHEVLVCTDRETLTSRSLPAELRTVLEQFAFTEAEVRGHLGLNQGVEA